MGAAATLARPFRRSREAFNGFGSSGARSKLDTRKWTPELLKQLEWRRFEELCAAYFEMTGFDSASIVVQCKPWNAYRVGIKPVRELHGAMASAKLGQGMLVTSSRFTQEAVAFAGKENIQLIDGAELLGRFAALLPEQSLALLKLATQGDFLTPTCPACSIKMISRKSTKEGRKFWGCPNYPRCKQTFTGTANAPA